jgi:hypothetical protein
MSEEKETYFRADTPPWGIHFQGDDGEVGKLEFDEHGELHFEGNATEAAKIFFDSVIKINSQALTDERSLSKMGYEVVQDFLPNVAQCALQDYGRLNDFMIMAAREFDD